MSTTLPIYMYDNWAFQSLSLVDSISNLRVVKYYFSFNANFSRTFNEQSSEYTDQMPQFAASCLGPHCLHKSHKKDARLIWVTTA